MNSSAIPPFELAALPVALRAVLDAELAAGNAIARVGFGPPAPPGGACIHLARPIATRRENSPDGLSASAWPNWDHATGLTDAHGRFFLVNPPAP